MKNNIFTRINTITNVMIVNTLLSSKIIQILYNPIANIIIKE
jgi:hypothetical protein